VLWKIGQAAGLQPDEGVYGTLREMYTQGEQWERLEAVAELMHKAGVQPDEETYRTLLSAYDQTEQVRPSLVCSIRGFDSGASVEC